MENATLECTTLAHITDRLTAQEAHLSNLQALAAFLARAPAHAGRDEYATFAVFDRVPGPLPRTSAPIQLDGGTVAIFASGAGWRAKPGTLGLALEVAAPGAAPVVLEFGAAAGEADGHPTLVSGVRTLVNVAPGNYTFTLRPADGSLTKHSDTFEVVVLELPPGDTVQNVGLPSD